MPVATEQERAEGLPGGRPRFLVLGPFQAVGEDGAEMRIQQLQRAALAVLLLRGGAVCPHAVLAAALWGDQPPARPEGALRTIVWNLRKDMGADGARVETAPGGYLFRADPAETDIGLFGALAGRGRAEWYRRKPAQAAATLAAALGLWREPELGALPAGPATAADRARLVRARNDAQDTLADARLALGQHGELPGELRAVVAADPLREHTWVQLITALYCSGDRSGALDAYAAAERALTKAYGAGPGPEVTEIGAWVARGGPPRARGPRHGGARLRPAASPASRTAPCTGRRARPRAQG